MASYLTPLLTLAGLLAGIVLTYLLHGRPLKSQVQILEKELQETRRELEETESARFKLSVDSASLQVKADQLPELKQSLEKARNDLAEAIRKLTDTQSALISERKARAARLEEKM